MPERERLASEHAGIERKLGNLETGLAWLKEWLQASQDKAERDAAAIRDRLEKDGEAIRDRLEKSQIKADHERGAIRDKLDAIDRKIDPMAIRVDALEFQVKAHEVTLGSIEDRRKDWTAAMRVGRWLVHGAWMLAATVAIVWSEEIKPMAGKLMKLWSK